MPTITLLTDFGTRDGFVAAMKGVILSIAPDARLVDAGHEVDPGDREAAAWILWQYWELYPADTVHLAVVDPGVGSERKAIAVRAKERYVVAPDNGVVTRVLMAAADWTCRELAEPTYRRARPSATFHGRDVFAPAAAHLARGVPLERLGPEVRHPVRLAMEPPLRRDGEVRGRIAHVDRFGNLITDIPSDWVGPTWQFELTGKAVGRLRRTYADVSPGEPAVVIGSMETVEIAVRDGSAAERLGAARGDPVTGRRQGPDG